MTLFRFSTLHNVQSSDGSIFNYISGKEKAVSEIKANQENMIYMESAILNEISANNCMCFSTTYVTKEVLVSSLILHCSFNST